MPDVAYIESGPADVLRPFVVCSWTRGAAAGGSASAQRILPDGCVDIVWDGQALVVAGPDTKAVLLDPDREVASYAGVRFRPGAAPTMLGLPASDLRDERVPLAAIWGERETQRLTDRLSHAASANDASRVLEGALVGRLDAALDPLVTGAVNAIATRPSLPVNGLAAQLGVTDRTLHRRVVFAVGYAPKVLQRVARFRRFLAFAHRYGDHGLARLASLSGYADQAHLSRECNALAGLTPLQLLRGSDVRLVQDGLTRKQAGSD